jgi:hypothetical protein
MTKYRAQITIEFETDSIVSEFTMDGTLEAVGALLDRLPDVAISDESKSKAAMSVQRIP